MFFRPILLLVGLFVGWGTAADTEDDLRAAAAPAPEDVAARAQLASALEAGGDFPGAIEQYEACAKLATGDILHLHALARLYERERRYSDAINTYKTLTAQDPELAGGYYRKLLDLQLSRKDEAGVLATAKLLLEQAPNDARLRSSLSIVFLRLRQRELALEHAREAVRLAPKDPRYCRQLADMLMVREQFGEAIEVVRQLLANTLEREERLEALRVLSSLYGLQGRQNDLTAEWGDRLQLAPGELQTCEELATLWESARQPERGFEVIESALAAGADRQAVMLALVRHAETTENFEKVVSVLEQWQALGEVPNSAALDALARAQVALGNLEGVRETWQQLDSVSPADAEVCLTRYKLLSQKTSKAEAMPLLEQAIALDGNNSAARFAYADVLYDAGRLPEAIAQVQSILAMAQELPSHAADAPIPPLELSAKDLVFRFRAMHLRYGPEDYGCVLRPTFGGGTYESARETPHPRLFTKPPQISGDERSLTEIRPKALAMLASLARKIAQEAELLKPWVDRLAEHPRDMRNKEDLVELYQKTGSREEALALVESLRAQRPEDEQLVRKMAELYASKREDDKALSVLEGFVNQGDPQRLLLGRELAQRYREAGRVEDRTRLLASLHGQDPEDMTVLRSLLDDAVDAKDWPRAEAMLAELGKLPLQNFAMLLLDFAGIARLGDQLALAKKYYIACIANEGGPQGYHPSASKIFIYDPYKLPKSRAGGTNLAMAGEELGLGGEKLMALEQLQTLLLNPAAYKEAIREAVIAPVELLIAEPRPESSLALPKLYLGMLLQKNQLGEARILLGRLRAAGLNDCQLDNLDLYLLAANNEFESLDKRYAELLSKYPSQTAEIKLAQAELALECGDFERAEREVRALLEQKGVQSRLLFTIGRFSSKKQPERALSLCDAWLAIAQPEDASMLSLASRVLAEAGRPEQAEELLWQAWDRAAAERLLSFETGTAKSRPKGSELDDLLRKLFNLAQQNQQLDQLFSHLRQRVEDHAEVTAYRWYLIDAFRLAERNDDAIVECGTLLATSPDDAETKLQLAQLLVKSGRSEEARALYEELLERQPARAAEVSAGLPQFSQPQAAQQPSARSLAGQPPQVPEVAAAQTAVARLQEWEELKQLAHTLAGQEKHDEAVEIYRKALALRPTDTWQSYELAKSLMTLNRTEESIKALQLFTGDKRNCHHFGGFILKDIVELYTKAGRRKEISEASAGAPSFAPGLAELLRVQIAIEEQRYDDALKMLDTVTAEDCANPVKGCRLQIAELRGDWDSAIAILERDFQRSGHADTNRLAELHMKAGRLQQASEFWDMNQPQGGRAGCERVLNRLLAEERWTEAEAYFREATSKPAMESTARQALIVALFKTYLETGKFKEVLSEALAASSVEVLPRAASLSAGMGKDQSATAAVRFEELISSMPENNSLLRIYADFKSIWGIPR